MAPTALYDTRELARFLASGLISTLGNVLVVMAAAQVTSYSVALVLGILVAATISYVLTKFLVFIRPSSSGSIMLEGGRFALVYGTGCLLYFLAAIYSENLLSGYFDSENLARFGGVIVGASVMLVTSYLGHRFFTYFSPIGRSNLD